jgi:hypothetical protein
MIKEKIAQEVKNAVLPEMEKMMIKAHETVKESQGAFLNEVSGKLVEWEKEILRRVDLQVEASLSKHGHN